MVNTENDAKTMTKIQARGNTNITLSEAEGTMLYFYIIFKRLSRV